MRVKALAIAAAVGLLGVPGLATAASAMPSLTQTGTVAQPEFLPVRDGCGPGLRAVRWQDRWGRWRWRCEPFRGWGPGRWHRPYWGPGGGYYR